MSNNHCILSLLSALSLFSSCDNHVYEDLSWHSWTPGMVYCANGDITTYERCVEEGNTPEAVIFHISNADETTGVAYAVSLHDCGDGAFIDPDTTYVSQGTSANIAQLDGETNTTALRYSKIESPIALSVNAKYFIPSVAEMYLLYSARNAVNSTIEKCGGSVLPIDNEGCWYWTSTECDGSQTDRAWRYSLYSGRFESADKHYALPTRPIMSIRLNDAEK